MVFNEIFIGGDHASRPLKSDVSAFLLNQGMRVEDCGSFSDEPCDYPDFAASVCKKVLETPGSCGILICGSGIGMSIAANRFSGIRAALCCSSKLASLAREHNDANVLCLGARFTSREDVLNMVRIFTITKFLGGKYSLRLKKIDESF